MIFVFDTDQFLHSLQLPVFNILKLYSDSKMQFLWYVLLYQPDTGNYDDLFTDRFAGDFGHATKKGNRLIAENVAKHILNNVLESNLED